MGSNLAAEICGTLGCRQVDDLGRYLGMPLFHKRVSLDVVNEEGGWSWDIFARNLPANVFSRIAAIRPPSDEAGIDRLAWRWSSGGANDKLQTNAVRHHWGMTMDEFCTICGQTRESNLRAVRDCWAAVVLWKSLVPSQSQNWFFTLSLDEWLQENLTNSRAMALKSECLVWAKHTIDSKVKLRNDEAKEDALLLHLRRLCSRPWTVVVNHVGRAVSASADAMTKMFVHDQQAAMITKS
ncbi:hypothetical protein GOBAR_DD30285 [Gossypium barbadense]|nr:hypothetical protein GOBAR_DD30285 [Gossypium barbadense]